MANLSRLAQRKSAGQEYEQTDAPGQAHKKAREPGSRASLSLRVLSGLDDRHSTRSAVGALLDQVIHH